MGKCKDCKFWNQEQLLRGSLADFRGCSELLKISLEGKSRKGILASKDCLLFLLVGANFGCIHFERRKE